MNLDQFDYPILPFKAIYSRLDKFQQNWLHEKGKRGMAKNGFRPSEELQTRKIAVYDQFQVLTDSFLWELKSNPEALAFLAYVEWQPKADQIFFGNMARYLRPKMTRFESTRFGDSRYMDHNREMIFRAVESGAFFARKLGKDSSKRKDTMDRLAKIIDLSM
jgi:hypothetical protein